MISKQLKQIRNLKEKNNKYYYQLITYKEEINYLKNIIEEYKNLIKTLKEYKK